MSILHLGLDPSVIVCALVCLYMLHVWRSSKKTNASFLPGPKGLPLIGNYFDMQETEIWEATRKWGERYGPLVHARVFGTSYIFLNSYQTAVDLFEKRGSIYSSRPVFPMMVLEGYSGCFVSFLPYGDELRSARRMLHQFLKPTVVSEYNDLQTQSAHRMLERLLDAPDNYVQLLRQAAGESILLVAYGYRPLPKDDPYILRIETCIESALAASDFSLVNAFPPLRYLPAWLLGAGFQNALAEGRKLSAWFAREPHEMAKRIMSNGTATSSMTSKLMSAEIADNGSINNEALISKVTGIAYVGGADTTVSALHTFLLAMLLYPNVQQRAQEELDQVIGKDTLPSFEDRPRLPYIEAIVKEALRWQPVFPLSVPRVLDENDEYNGYLIPGGVTVFLNTWAITRDPEVYPEPDKFIPERWIPCDGKEPPFDVNKVAFGVGRRICSGRYFADNTVWICFRHLSPLPPQIFITAASILSAFNITKALGEDGVPITPKIDYKGSAIRHPEPFKYVLTPRSDRIGPIIRQTVDSESAK